MKSLPQLLFKFSLCFFFSFSYAQMPILTVAQKETTEVYLQKLDIDVRVTGNIANTVMTMTFKNASNRILEGELVFPMPEGVSVSRYALDINGKMREAVPVEKAKATQVFEDIERRRVDPGLLEKVEGNNFRTRIYPLPANGSRTVIIGYEEELSINGKQSLRYHLPLDYKKTIEQFSIKAIVNQNSTKPELEEQPDGNFDFTVDGNNYIAQITKQNFKPGKSLTITLPKPSDVPEIALQPAGNSFYFLINSFPKAQVRQKNWGNHLGIIWDASLSGLQRDTKKELALLNLIIQQKQNLTISLTQLNNRFTLHGDFPITNGNWETLRQVLETIVYDGGTNYSAIQTAAINADEFLFFTDGLSTFGPAEFNTNKPFYCINSATRADYSNLKWIADNSGGRFLNLLNTTAADAAKTLLQEPFQFLGIKTNEHIREFYPAVKTPVNSNISIAGILDANTTSAVLQFGYGNEVTTEKTVLLDGNKKNSNGINISRVWAQKKIADLDIRYEQNKAVIGILAKQFGIVTRNTSLIVLETINDYITYEIEPPAELRNEYDNIMKQRFVDRQQNISGILNNAIASVNSMKLWWAKKFDPAPVTNFPMPNPTTANTGNTTISRADSIFMNTLVAANTIRGQIIDAEGNAIVGAAAILKGTRVGTVTDQNGFFNLQKNAKSKKLVVSAVGMQTKTLNFGNNNSLRVKMQQSENALDEVVVVGYGRSDTGGGTDTEGDFRDVADNTEAIAPASHPQFRREATAMAPAPVQNQLQGRVTGVQISSAGSNKKIRVRGISSVSSNVQPIYIVDGVATDEVPPQDKIASMQVLKDANATAIYGAKASNGAIVITTKANGAIGNNDSEQLLQSSAKINAVPIKSDNTYTHTMNAVKTNPYQQYLVLRKEYINTPVFYFDMANWFFAHNDSTTALMILSNMAELDLENTPLMKLMAYQLKAVGAYKEELFACSKILQWRPMEPQSYRDLGLALADNGQYQQALDTLYAALSQSYATNIASTNTGIEEIIATEINQLVTTYGGKLNTTRIDAKILADMPVDIRVVLNWNMNDTDIDLWVTDPNNEKCFYSHNQTALGGHMSRDFTRGYGPEQFLLKKAVAGTYKIEVNYFGDRQINPAISTAVMAEIFIHYASGNQERKIITLQMPKQKKEGVLVGEFKF